jgi:hypothetical protein
MTAAERARKHGALRSKHPEIQGAKLKPYADPDLEREFRRGLKQDRPQPVRYVMPPRRV